MSAAAAASGQHFTADLSGCAADHPWMQSPEALAQACLGAVQAHGLTAVGQLFHRFTPRPGQTQSGVTGVVLLAESHLAVHTWPELGQVTLDVFVCNQSVDHSEAAHQLLQALVAGFEPGHARWQGLTRGA